MVRSVIVKSVCVMARDVHGTHDLHTRSRLVFSEVLLVPLICLRCTRFIVGLVQWAFWKPFKVLGSQPHRGVSDLLDAETTPLVCSLPSRAIDRHSLRISRHPRVIQLALLPYLRRS